MYLVKVMEVVEWGENIESARDISNSCVPTSQQLAIFCVKRVNLMDYLCLKS